MNQCEIIVFRKAELYYAAADRPYLDIVKGNGIEAREASKDLLVSAHGPYWNNTVEIVDVIHSSENSSLREWMFDRMEIPLSSDGYLMVEVGDMLLNRLKSLLEGMLERKRLARELSGEDRSEQDLSANNYAMSVFPSSEGATEEYWLFVTDLYEDLERYLRIGYGSEVFFRSKRVYTW